MENAGMQNVVRLALGAGSLILFGGLAFALGEPRVAAMAVVPLVGLEIAMRAF